LLPIGERLCLRRISRRENNALASGDEVIGYARANIAETNDCGFHGFTPFQVWLVLKPFLP
jgi:hypothetical protein